MHNKADDESNDIFYNFIQDINDFNSNQSNNHKKTSKKDNKEKKTKPSKNNKNKIIENKDDKEDKEDKEENELKIQIKLMKCENDLLMKKLIKKDDKLKEYKNKCKKQTEKINELKNKIFELNNKRKSVNRNVINSSFGEVERQVGEEYNSNYFQDSFKHASNKNISTSNQIETVKFDIDYSKFFQCGICMDSFYDGEMVKKLPCGHIYHKDCLNQWILTKNNCPFCDKIIFHK
jgi:hypothetical protein